MLERVAVRLFVRITRAVAAVVVVIALAVALRPARVVTVAVTGIFTSLRVAVAEAVLRRHGSETALVTAVIASPRRERGTFTGIRTIPPAIAPRVARELAIRLGVAALEPVAEHATVGVAVAAVEATIRAAVFTMARVVERPPPAAVVAATFEPLAIPDVIGAISVRNRTRRIATGSASR